MIFGKSYSEAVTFNSLTGVANIQAPLPANRAIKKMLVRLNATINVTTAGGGVVFNDYGWYSLISNLKLIVNGKNAFEWTPYMFYFIDAFLTENQNYYGNSLPTVTNMETAGSYNLELNIPIHLNQAGLQAIEAYNTLLITSSTYMKKPYLELTPNSINSIFASSTTTLPVYNLSNISVDILQDEIVDGLAGVVNFPKFEIATKRFSSSGTNQQFDIPENKILRGLVFECLTPNSILGSNSLINNISVYSGNNEIIKDLTFDDFQADYLSYYPSDRLSNINTNGRVFMDFCYKDKTLANVISTTNSTSYFKLNLSGAAVVNLYMWTINK
jgi:hypothetical protein